MNKVYLLLRNNRKTGPHSLEELIQLGLKPLDLIWIEGKSFGWSYPSEIGELKPYVAQLPETAVNEPALHETASATVASSKTLHQPYMPEQKKTTAPPSAPKKIYVSLPANMVQQPSPADQQPAPQKSAAEELEQKAEELRKRAQAYMPGNKPAEAEGKQATEPLQKRIQPAVPDNVPSMTNGDVAQIKYARPVGELEEDYSSWIYSQKSKKKKNLPWAHIATAIAAVLLLAVGFSVSKHIFSEKETVAQELTEKGTPGNEALIPVENEPEAPVPETINTPTSPSALEESAVEEPADKGTTNTSFASNTTSAKVPKKDLHVSKQVAVMKKPVPASQPVEEAKQNTVPVEQDNKNKEIANPNSISGTAASSAPRKKKTLGEALGSFFGKFKRKDEVRQEAKTDKPAVEKSKSTTQEVKKDKSPVEKPQSTEQAPGTERKAMRRGDVAVSEKTAEVTANTASAEKINFEDYIDISSNEPAEKWMLGVHGLKLTICNRSKETLRTAAVEVRYYNEQNEVLDKKVVNFSNVPPSKSVTQSIPDHRLADHTDYRFLAANN